MCSEVSRHSLEIKRKMHFGGLAGLKEQGLGKEQMTTTVGNTLGKLQR